MEQKSHKRDNNEVEEKNDDDCGAHKNNDDDGVGGVDYNGHYDVEMVMTS